MWIAILLLLSVGLGILLWTACTHLLFWYETLQGPQRRALRKAYGSLFLLGCTSFSTTLASQAAVLLLYPFGRASLRRQAPPKGGPPILLVHGVYHNASAWFFWKRTLGGLGLHDLSTMNYSVSGRRDIDIEALAEQLGEQRLRTSRYRHRGSGRTARRTGPPAA